MKRLFGLFAFIASCYGAQAQEIGIRGGDVLSNNIAVECRLAANILYCK